MPPKDGRWPLAKTFLGSNIKSQRDFRNGRAIVALTGLTALRTPQSSQRFGEMRSLGRIALGESTSERYTKDTLLQRRPIAGEDATIPHTSSSRQQSRDFLSQLIARPAQSSCRVIGMSKRNREALHRFGASALMKSMAANCLAGVSRRAEPLGQAPACQGSAPVSFSNS